MLRFLSRFTIPLVMFVSASMSGAGVPEAAVADVLDTLHQAASKADGETYFSLFAENAVYMGTDATERWSVAEFRRFAEPYFSKGRGWTYEVKDRHIVIAEGGETAWFDEILWNASYGTCRGTGVLVLLDNEWRITQYHLTIPIPNEIAKDVVGQIRERSKSD